MTSLLLEDLIKLEPDLFTSFSVDLQSVGKLDIDFLISNYFRDHIVNLGNYKSNLYKIYLERKEDIYYFAEDKNELQENLGWLIPNFQLKYLPFYFIFDKSSMLCLNDAWSLLGWLNYELTTNNNKEEIVIIHFDSHADLMSPMIGKNNKGSYLDLINGTNFDIKNLWDVFKSICIGSIGIGSFISLLPLIFKKVNVFHINQFANATEKFGISLNLIQDNLISENFNGYKRLDINYFNMLDNKNCHGLYSCSSSIEDIDLNIIKDKKIYLHIDMDYFNNKYDGSRPEFRQSRYDIPYDDQLKLIKKIINFLDQNKLQSNIIHTSIALSPGFFPSQYHGTITPKLIELLNKIGISFCPSKIFPS